MVGDSKVIRRRTGRLRNYFMLREMSNVRQALEEPRRRWFADDYFDLIVWLGNSGEFTGFQLCYDKSGDEHALTWHKETGFNHHRVDSGELQRPYKAPPILAADGVLDFGSLTHLFQQRSRKMDQLVARFVLDKIEAIQPDLETH
jgi:hypothetical protein